MSNTTEPTKVYLVRDNNGNFHEMDRKTCGHCKTELQIGEAYHVDCVKEYKIRENIMLQKRKEQADIDKYGSVLSDHERKMREFPNSVVGYDGLTYNQRLEKEQTAKVAAEHKKQMDAEIEQRRVNAIMNNLCVIEMRDDLLAKIKILEQENARLKSKHA